MPVLNETDVYREIPAPPALRRSIACLWIRRGDGDPVRVLPDACTDIVWRPGAGPVVAGPDTRAWLSPTVPGETVVGVRLRPGAGGAALGLPLAELLDQRVPLSEMPAPPPGDLDEAPDPGRVLELLAATACRLAARNPPDRAVQAAIVRLRHPGQRVDLLAGDLGFSERQLRRRFLASVGYGPKTLQRVLRLHRFLADAADGAPGAPVSLALAALDAGYADQAHLARECRALTGLTPGELVAGHAAGRAATSR